MSASKAPIHFGPYVVSAQVFHTTRLSMAMVNLKPLIPGHLLVCPKRVAPRLTDLTSEEITDLGFTLQRISRLVERVYGATSLNIAMQDGVDAGQSVPHVHWHVIPRKKQDLDEKGGGDAIYGMLEGEGGNVGRHQYERQMWQNRPQFPHVDDASRHPRSDADMRKEADMLAAELEREKS